MQQQRRVGRPIGAQQGYNNQGAGGYQQQQNQGSKARFTNSTIQFLTLRSQILYRVSCEGSGFLI